MTANTHAVAYLRVSTEEQAQEGLSLQAQEASVRAYCAMRGLSLGEVVCDAAVSGGKPLGSRAGGIKLLKLVKRRKVRAVVAWKLERLFRDCADCLMVVRDWDKTGVSLHLVDLGGQAVDTSSAMGRFFLTVMAAAAELERNQIRERTAAVMRYKAQKGEFTGGEVPYGYSLADDGVHLWGIAAEQQVMTQAKTLSQRGLSLRAIGAELERRALKPRQGHSWHPEQIKRLLRRAA